MKKSAAFKSTLKTWFDDLLWLIYPSYCNACSKPLLVGEETLCTECRVYLPKTNLHLSPENTLEKLFWGKFNVKSASAYCYYFARGVRPMIHRFKYNGRKHIGFFIGNLYGRELKEVLTDVDVIVPVPIHKKKLRKRGYNQSEWFASGLSNQLGVPTNFTSVQCHRQTKSQTVLHGFDRFLNKQDNFSVVSPELLNGKTILLVDDVVTTGSTLTSCAEAIEKSCTGTKIRIATIAKV